jgi:hypothetical protein
MLPTGNAGTAQSCWYAVAVSALQRSPKLTFDWRCGEVAIIVTTMRTPFAPVAVISVDQ